MLDLGTGRAAEPEPAADMLVVGVSRRQDLSRAQDGLGVGAGHAADHGRGLGDPAGSVGRGGNEQPSADGAGPRPSRRYSGSHWWDVPAELDAHGRFHQVVAVHLAPHERDLRAAGAGTDLEEGARGRAPGPSSTDEDLQMEHGGRIRQRGQEACGGLADRAVERRIVLLDRAEHAAAAKAQAGVDVSGGPEGHHIAAVEHAVHVVDRVCAVRLHQQGLGVEAHRGKVRRSLQPHHSGAGAADAWFHDHRPPVVGGEVAHGIGIVGLGERGDRQSGLVYGLTHRALIAEHQQVVRARPRALPFLPQLGADE